MQRGIIGLGRVAKADFRRLDVRCNGAIGVPTSRATGDAARCRDATPFFAYSSAGKLHDAGAVAACSLQRISPTDGRAEIVGTRELQSDRLYVPPAFRSYCFCHG